MKDEENEKSEELTDEMREKAREMITKARVQMLSKQPFWGQVCMHLTFKEVDVPDNYPFIMGVNRFGRVYYNPKKVLELSLEELKAVICHEVMHCGLEHLERRNGRNKEKWNIAADICVNYYVAQSFRLPPNAVRNDSLAEGKCVEEIYDLLPEPQRCPGYPNMCSKCKAGGNYGGYGEYYCPHFDEHVEKGDEKDKPDDSGRSGKKGKSSKDIKKGIRNHADMPNWRKIFRDAYEYAKTIGKEPLGMERLFDEFFEPQLNWSELLARFVSQIVPHDFTYTRPHKKSIVAGYYMPSLKKQFVDVIVAVDTSGSISQQELVEFMSEVRGIFQQFQAVRVTIMSCDTKVYNPQTVTSEIQLKGYRPYGGGGTDFRPVFKYIREHIDNPRILIFFTDLYGVFPSVEEVPADLAVIWVASSNARKEDAPIGITIRMEKRGRN